MALPPLMLGAVPPLTAAAVLLPAGLGLVSIFMLLPRSRSRNELVGTCLGLMALFLAAVMWRRGGGPLVEWVLFAVFAGMALAFGALMLTQHNPVRAALSFAVVVLSTCGLFLLQAAPFVMAATIIVYAGAIVVTFVFVIMLAQQSGYSSADHRSHESFLATVAGFVLLAALVYVLGLSDTDRLQSFPTAAADEVIQRIDGLAKLQSVEEIKRSLRDSHLWTDLRRVADADRGGQAGRRLYALVQESERLWDEEWQRHSEAAAPRRALVELAALARQVRATYDDEGHARMPADNVAALGRTLFSDFFLAVELGGTLLLVATVGAIAIAGRREGGQ
jgi:NADH-quinone oxidoreductase subunit J